MVNQRQAELTAAQKRFARTRTLVASNALPQQQLDDDRAVQESAAAALVAARAQVLSAQAGVEAAKSQVIEAQSAIEAATASTLRLVADIDDSVLRAPRAGRVQYRIAQPGEVLAPGGRLVLSVPNATGFAPFHRLGALVPGAWLRGKLLPYEHPANTDQPIDTCWTYGEILALVRAGGFAVDACDGLAYFRYLEMLPVLRDAWRPVVPAAERLLPRLGAHRFAYHVLLRCRPADAEAARC